MPGPGNRVPRGVKPNVENPGKLFKRLMSYVFVDYKLHCILVFILIIMGVLCNVQGTMFTRALIDDYIAPLLLSDSPDFTPLAHAIARVACFYATGVICVYTQNRIMVNVTQGVLRNIRDDVFEHMERLPIRFFDSHTHGDVMSVYTNDIDTLEPYSIDTKYITNIPTKSGWHIITTPFNLQQFKEKYPNIDVHKNNPTLLYCL